MKIPWRLNGKPFEIFHKIGISHLILWIHHGRFHMFSPPRNSVRHKTVAVVIFEWFTLPHTPFSGMICHPWAKTRYQQPAYQI